MIKHAQQILILLLALIFLASCTAGGDHNTSHPTDHSTQSSDSSQHSSEVPSSGSTQGRDETPATDATQESISTPWQHESALTRFLSEVNHSGVIEHGTEPVPPGTLPEPGNIPQPEQSPVGQTVSIILAQDQQAIPFHYICTDGSERLTVVINDHIPLLIVFETSLGGIDALCGNIANETPFNAKIIAMVNISREEYIYTVNAARQIPEVPAENYIDIDDPTSPAADEFIGIVGTDSAEKYRTLLMQAENTHNEYLQKNFEVYAKIYARFELTSFFPS